MNLSLCLQVFAMLFFLLPQAYADSCDQDITIGDAVRASWNSNCTSINYLRYDPYGPETGYPATFFQFELDRTADIKISMSDGYHSYYSKLFLIAGNNKNASPIIDTFDNTIETRLEAGSYIVEAANRLPTTSTFKVEYNDIGQNECVTELVMGSTITDGWISACESTSRDINDPYDTIPGEGHRAKYFTFTLLEDADIAIKVDATVDSYLYLLEGLGEHGTPYAEIPQESSSQFLPAGEYTLELTTYDRYAPGQFSLQVNSFVNNGECKQALSLGTTINGTWSADCPINSWLNGNGDPYQGGNSPERANYYSFTLQQATDIKFIRTSGNSNNTLMNLYAAGDYLNKLKSTATGYYWGSPAAEMSASLPAGDYELEITQTQQLASGQYEIRTEVLTTSGCNNLLSFAETKAGITSPACVSNNRGVDGNNDAYGSQSGTYYAKRFEFTLDEETAVRIAASTSESSYLYLAKKIDGILYPLTQSWSESSWNTTKYPSIERILDEGSYVIEVTSHYPEREMTFDLTLNSSSNAACKSFIRLNERRSNETLNYNCHSQAKAPVYNYNPYSSNNGRRFFYAKEYSFVITQAGNYDITTTSSSLDTHIFLFDGGDSHYPELDDISSASNNNTLSIYLTPGIYSTEITTSSPQQTGSFTLLVWDKSSAIADYEADTSGCSEFLSSNKHHTFTATLTSICTSESRGSRYNAKYYTFDTTVNSQVSFESQSSLSLYLRLSRWENNNWNIIASDSAYSGSAQLLKDLAAGSYRLEVSSLYPDATGAFTLTASISLDSDHDGITDENDAFPNDATEWLDTDNDGYGDRSDMDDDNDQVADIEDAFPLDNTESQDSDLDGIGDNSDTNPFPNTGDIRFSASRYTVIEGAETIDITVNRINAFSNTAVFYFTRDLSANAITDYAPTLGKLEFLGAESEKILSIPLTNNSLYSGKRSFEIILVARASNSPSFSQGHAAVIDIIDDEVPSSSISFAQNFIQTAENENNLVLTINRSGDISRADTVYFRTIDGSASAFSDYLPQSGQIDFPAHAEQVTMEIVLSADDTAETEESFFVELLSAEHAVILEARTEISIASEISAQDTVYFFALEEVNFSSVNPFLYAEISVLRNNSDTQASVSFSAKGLTDEYDHSSIITFEAGEKGKIITLPIIPSNTSFYSQRAIELTLLAATNGHFVSHKPMHINIIDSTNLPYSGALVTNSDNIQIKEGSSANLVVGYLHDMAFEKEISLETLAGTATANEDFEPIESTFILTPEHVSDHITLTILNDEIIEDKETLRILSKDQSTPIMEVTIINNANDQQGGIASFSTNQITAEENTLLTLALQRLYGNSGRLSFDINTRDGSALAGVHYRGLSNTQVFESGETLLDLNIELLDLADNPPLFFYIDMTTQLESGKSFTETLRIDITQSTASTESKKSDNGFLGLGFINAWLLLLLASPLLFSRVRLIKKP